MQQEPGSQEEWLDTCYHLGSPGSRPVLNRNQAVNAQLTVDTSQMWRHQGKNKMNNIEHGMSTFEPSYPTTAGPDISKPQSTRKYLKTAFIDMIGVIEEGIQKSPYKSRKI